MLEEIQRRNFTESTRRAYLRIIEDFARYFNRPPDQLGPEHIREYIAHLFRDKKLADNSVNQTVGALRFFFVKMLKRPWRVDETPYPKKRMRFAQNEYWSDAGYGHESFRVTSICSARELWLIWKNGLVARLTALRNHDR